nr:hypothetical protein CFP56_36665 [Quercus suber]
MSHAWLPNAPVFVNAPTREMKVRELIEEDTRQWDRGKIHALFDRRACEDILAVPLNQLSSPDKLIWKENRTHSFSVRTAYQVALRLKNRHQSEHSSVQVHPKVIFENAMCCLEEYQRLMESTATFMNVEV